MFEQATEAVTRAEELKVWIGIFVTAGVVLVSSGIAWGTQLTHIRSLRRRMGAAEKTIKENLEDGKFVRTETCQMRNIHSDERFNGLTQQIAEVKADTKWLRDHINKLLGEHE